MLARHTQLAIGGSVRSAEFIGKVRTVGLKGSGFTDEGDLNVDARQYHVNLLVPRPPALE